MSTKHQNVMAEWAKTKFGLDLPRTLAVLAEQTATFSSEQGTKSDQLAGALIITAQGQIQMVPFDCPVFVDKVAGLCLPREPEAFVLRARDKDDRMRWYICTTAPSGQMLRILTSYDGKAQAERAIKTLGYKLIPTPKGQALADMAVPS